MSFSHKLLSQSRFLLIGGPCVIEGMDMLDQVCKHVLPICKKLDIDYVFKASFDKANRSSIHSYRGPGMEDGLNMLKKIKDKYSVKILTDVHLPEQIEQVSPVVDLIQIPAFLARQTDFYVEAGKRNLSINVKKGQFMSPQEMKTVIEKFRESGGEDIMITERGSFFGYGNLVVDFRSIDMIRDMGVPYIFDGTHSVQLPAAGEGRSLGQRHFVKTLTKAQVAAGANGVFLEMHPDIENAKSDQSTQLPLKKVEALLEMLKKYHQFNLENDLEIQW